MVNFRAKYLVLVWWFGFGVRGRPGVANAWSPGTRFHGGAVEEMDQETPDGCEIRSGGWPPTNHPVRGLCRLATTDQ